jgi:hypothetical protein
MSEQSTITSLQRLSSIWARLIASSTYVIWTKLRIHYLKAKWYIEDELHIMKPSKPQVHHKNAHKSNSSQRIDTPTSGVSSIDSQIGTPIIQRENGFI